MCEHKHRIRVPVCENSDGTTGIDDSSPLDAKALDGAQVPAVNLMHRGLYWGIKSAPAA